MENLRFSSSVYVVGGEKKVLNKTHKEREKEEECRSTNVTTTHGQRISVKLLNELTIFLYKQT